MSESSYWRPVLHSSVAITDSRKWIYWRLTFVWFDGDTVFGINGIIMKETNNDEGLATQQGPSVVRDSCCLSTCWWLQIHCMLSAFICDSWAQWSKLLNQTPLSPQWAQLNVSLARCHPDRSQYWVNCIHNGWHDGKCTWKLSPVALEVHRMVRSVWWRASLSWLTTLKPDWDGKQLSTFGEADWAAEWRQCSSATTTIHLRLLMTFNWTSSASLSSGHAGAAGWVRNTKRTNSFLAEHKAVSCSVRTNLQVIQHPPFTHSANTE